MPGWLYRRSTPRAAPLPDRICRARAGLDLLDQRQSGAGDIDAQGAAQPEASRDDKANQTTEDVAEGIDYGVAVIAERGGRGTVTIDNEVCVFKDFPTCLDRDGQRQLPVCAETSQQQRNQPEKHEAVQHVRKAVGIEKVLRVVGTANLARPNLNAAAGAYP